MQEGINLDPTTLITVQSERIASAAIREAQLTAAVQQLTMEVMSLKEQWTAANTPVDVGMVPLNAVPINATEEGTEDANADDDS